MLIDFDYIVSNYQKPKGIIHIGAHLMEERDKYLANKIDNIIWIEANSKICDTITRHINTDINESVFNYAISDVDDVYTEFFITNNGQSSSILELDKHKIHHPHIFVSEVNIVKTKRIDSIINENNINIDNFDFVNLDIQGAELLALKGFGLYLHNIKFVYTEINTASIYKNCALLEDLDRYLFEFGFERVETKITEFEWGDALYKKNK